MEFLKHKPSEFGIDYLVSQYHALARITQETHANGQTRLRYKPVDNTPGVWISENDARPLLETECAKHQDRLRKEIELYKGLYK